MKNKSISVVMLGATGAVGTEALKGLLALPSIKRITTLGRRPVLDMPEEIVQQHKVDIFNPATYTSFLANHQAAICTLGVGEPSKISREDFLKIDKVAVLDFAKACKKAGVPHFQLLSSVGISSTSRSFFLRAKGELVDELEALNFDRLSIFQPSMILTPTNRYGFAQGLTLKVWPKLNLFLSGSLKKYRGIKVAQLGKAFAGNLLVAKTGMEFLTWETFLTLSENIDN